MRRHDKIFDDRKQFKVSLDYEMVDNIVRDSMLEMYEELKDSQEKTDFDNLEDFQKEDYEYDKTLLEATKILYQQAG